MDEVRESKFIIIRKDRAEGSKTIICDGLRIGRLPDSDVWLNHPKVSRLHAGVNRIDEYFYLINLSGSSATTLNGRAIPFDEGEALTAGDEIQIGPFFLHVDRVDDALKLTVILEFAVNAGESGQLHKFEEYQQQLIARRGITGALQLPTGALVEPASLQAQRSAEATNALKVFWNKRTREKAGRPSPLHPRRPPRQGKIRFNWTPTGDLVRPWPFAVFVWAIVIVGGLSTFGAFAHKNAFAPAPVSDPHARQTLSLTPVIAKHPSAGSCTACHAVSLTIENSDKMNANCAACHDAEGFSPSVIPAHRVAGITCTDCHTEHRGKDFWPMNAAFESCVNCHSDANKNLYRGKGVHTPHGGTFGYPTANRVWIWKGLDNEELAQKSELQAFLKKNRVSSGQPQEWRNAQFHGIHLNQIPVVAGIDGIAGADGVTKILSCSSCHKTGYMGVNVDRDYPRTTCGHCHNAQVLDEPANAAAKETIPNCTSCHMQHVKDVHWQSRFVAALRKAKPKQ
jgi:hypothetical protein